MANLPPEFRWNRTDGENGRAYSAWSHMYVGCLIEFDGDWLGSSVADVASAVYGGWTLDHLIDDSIEGALPSTAISMETIDERFRIHQSFSHREVWARALAAPAEVQREAVRLVRAKTAQHWLDSLQSCTDLSMYTYGSAVRYARELIGGVEHQREWKESRRILAQWLMYAHNLMQTTGCELPEIPSTKLSQAQIGKWASPDLRFAKTTMRDDELAAAIELAQVGYQAFRIQLATGVPGATASEIAWAEHGPLRVVVAPPPPPRVIPTEHRQGWVIYYFDQRGSEAKEIGVFSDGSKVMVGLAAHIWAPGVDPATVVGDYMIIWASKGKIAYEYHVDEDLRMYSGDEREEMTGLTVRDWMFLAGLPVPPRYAKKTVPRSQSRAAKSKKWRVLSSDRPLLIRTDFTDDALWVEIRDIAMSERTFINGSGELIKANILPVDDPAFEGLTLSKLLKLPWPDPETEEGPVYFFVVDGETVGHPEHPILAASLPAEEMESFRLTPEAMALAEVNLSIANLGFEDFQGDADGINREP